MRRPWQAAGSGSDRGRGRQQRGRGAAAPLRRPAVAEVPRRSTCVACSAQAASSQWPCCHEAPCCGGAARVAVACYEAPCCGGAADDAGDEAPGCCLHAWCPRPAQHAWRCVLWDARSADGVRVAARAVITSRPRARSSFLFKRVCACGRSARHAAGIPRAAVWYTLLLAHRDRRAFVCRKTTRLACNGDGAHMHAHECLSSKQFKPNFSIQYIFFNL